MEEPRAVIVHGDCLEELARLDACSVDAGRRPANVVHGGSDAALAGFPSGAARFFHRAKPSRSERDAGLSERSTRPTVKPIELMRWLTRLATPRGGLVLDPFAGSGTTAVAARLEGRRVIGTEREEEYARLAVARLEWWRA